jgi:hypothetical protein
MRSLIGLQAKTARVVVAPDGQEVDVPRAGAAGNIVLVRPGDRKSPPRPRPEGRSWMRPCSPASPPVTKKTGDLVFSHQQDRSLPSK